MNGSGWRVRKTHSLVVLDQAALLEKAFAAEPENFETAYDIGEAYRIQSFGGRAGLCGAGGNGHPLVCVRQTTRSVSTATTICAPGCASTGWTATRRPGHFNSRAESLDPNGYFTVANIGWHYVQTGDYLAAREWLERSVRLEWDRNVIGHSYLELVDQKLVENASGKNPLPPVFEGQIPGVFRLTFARPLLYWRWKV